MPVIQCDEASNPPSPNPDAVWVPNGNNDQLFYYNVDSCLTVTLVFANGLLGGHAGQLNQNSQQITPAANLLSVIKRMITLAPSKTTGALQEIWYIGTTGDQAWGLAQATETIWATYGGKDEVYGQYKDCSPIEIVFDTGTKKYSVCDHVKDQTAANTVANGTTKSY